MFSFTASGTVLDFRCRSDDDGVLHYTGHHAHVLWNAGAPTLQRGKESPASMTIPFVILGALTVVVGFLNSRNVRLLVWQLRLLQPARTAAIEFCYGDCDDGLDHRVGVAVVAYGYRIIPTDVAP